jgi:hypothetical protein
MRNRSDGAHNACRRYAMKLVELEFNDLMAEARRAMLALYDARLHNPEKPPAESVEDCRRAYAQLLEFQKSAWMTAPENCELQAAADLLRAHLKFYGEAV